MRSKMLSTLNCDHGPRNFIHQKLESYPNRTKRVLEYNQVSIQIGKEDLIYLSFSKQKVLTSMMQSHEIQVKFWVSSEQLWIDKKQLR